MKKLFTLILLALSSITIAQTPCDSMELDVKYGTFADSTLQVHVINHGQSFFSYPQFFVFDSNGDTVARENVNFFGISQESHHRLEVYPGAIPGNMFSGSLSLYYATIDSYAVCTWPMNFDLCPDTCQRLYPYLQNVGSQNVTGEAAWEITDVNNLVVASGIFILDTPGQYAFDSVCLEPAEYTYKVYDISLTGGGQKRIGINPYDQSIQIPFNSPDSAVLPFTLFEHCFIPTAIRDPKEKAGISIHSFESSVYLANKGNNALGDVAVYSLDGRRVYSKNIPIAHHNVDLSAFPGGIYIVRVTNKDGTLARKVVIQ